MYNLLRPEKTNQIPPDFEIWNSINNKFGLFLRNMHTRQLKALIQVLRHASNTKKYFTAFVLKLERAALIAANDFVCNSFDDLYSLTHNFHISI